MKVNELGLDDKPEEPKVGVLRHNHYDSSTISASKDSNAAAA